MTIVVDASLVAAALIESGPTGEWALDLLEHENLVAPQLLHVEVASVVRRAVLSGRLTADVAALAHEDLIDLAVDLYDYVPFAPRIWQLHHNVTTYDAWYVAIAEHLDVDLATIDRRLAVAAGPTCHFRVP